MLNRWCLHAELNHEFILTMDVYYHYTMQALINYDIEFEKRQLENILPPLRLI